MSTNAELCNYGNLTGPERKRRLKQRQDGTNLLQSRSLWTRRCFKRGMRSFDELDALLERLRLDTLRYKKKDKRTSQSHHPSTSSGRYVDYFRVLPTRFCEVLTFALHQLERGPLCHGPIISWGHLQLLERDCLVNA